MRFGCLKLNLTRAGEAWLCPKWAVKDCLYKGSLAVGDREVPVLIEFGECANEHAKSGAFCKWAVVLTAEDELRELSTRGAVDWGTVESESHFKFAVVVPCLMMVFRMIKFGR